MLIPRRVDTGVCAMRGRSRRCPQAPASRSRARDHPGPPLQPPHRKTYAAWIRRYVFFHGKRHGIAKRVSRHTFRRRQG
jgi:hypothetical protein